MSYRIYRTRAVVLKSMPHKEADKTFVLYTEDFGRIYVRAQGIRHEKSRLRYALQDLSVCQVSLVRGKAGWRITGASPEVLPVIEREALLAMARIAALVVRTAGGDEPSSYIFQTLCSAHELLREGHDPEVVEVASVSRILHALGYVAQEEHEQHVFAEAYESEILVTVRDSLPRFVSRINQALIATQL